MTVPTYFSLRAAEAAEDRDENGADLLPGDRELIIALDGYRSQEWDAYWEPIEAAQDAERERLWLTQQCPGCEDGGTGEPCTRHFDDWCYCGKPAAGGECVSCHNDVEVTVARSADL
jgi:hypothetical protein